MPYRTTCDRALIDSGVCTAWDDPPKPCPCGELPRPTPTTEPTEETDDGN